MKSTLFFTVIGLLSIMALNVQAACPANGCGSDKYCSNGVCKDKKAYGVTCSANTECKSDKCAGTCKCTARSGCPKSSDFCDTSDGGKCKAKLANGKNCKNVNNDSWCLSGDCSTRLQPNGQQSAPLCRAKGS